MNESQAISYEALFDHSLSELNELSERIIGCAIQVHKTLGPGLLESAYEVCLAHELRKAGLDAATQVSLPIIYDGISLDVGSSRMRDMPFELVTK